MLRLVLGLVFSVSIIATAHAQPEENVAKDPSTATALAIGGSLAGPAMIGLAFAVDRDGEHRDASTGLLVTGTAAILVGPSAGHWYAGKPLTWGLALRGGGAALMLGAAVVAASCAGEAFDGDGEGCGATAYGIYPLVVGGIAMVAGGTIYDIATAGAAARESNAKRVSVVPTVVPGSAPAAGLSVVGTF